MANGFRSRWLKIFVIDSLWLFSSRNNLKFSCFDWFPFWKFPLTNVDSNKFSRHLPIHSLSGHYDETFGSPTTLLPLEWNRPDQWIEGHGDASSRSLQHPRGASKHPRHQHIPARSSRHHPDQSCLTFAILECSFASTKKNEAILLQSNSFFHKN